MGSRAPAVVIVDRDGVVNADSASYVKTPAEWRALPGSLDAIAALTRAGTAVVVATNQSGVGRGLFSDATLGRIHARMTREIEARGGRLAGVYYCPHAPDAGCDCRKPRPGLLERIGRELGVELAGVPVIGDKAGDLEAAAAVGARGILVLTGHGTRTLANVGADVEHYADLAAAVGALLGHGT